MTKVQQCLALNIKKYRKEQHLTQEQLAEKINSSTNYIGTIEIGKKFPSPQMIERIANALNVESLQLFQMDTAFSYQEQIDLESLKKSLIKNIENAIAKSLDDMK